MTVKPEDDPQEPGNTVEPGAVLQEPHVKPTTESDEPALPDIPDPATEQEAERILAQANLQRMRGDHRAADVLIAKAYELAPGSAGVIQAQAEILVRTKQVKKAHELLSTGVKLHPDHAQLERMYAESVLRVHALADPMALLASVEGADEASLASARTASVLSLFLPGLGHLVIGQKVKGYVYIGIWTVCVVWALQVPGGLSSLFNMFGGANLQIGVLPPVLIGGIIYVVAVSELAALSKRADLRKVERPKPPVDLPFE